MRTSYLFESASSNLIPAPMPIRNKRPSPKGFFLHSAPVIYPISVLEKDIGSLKVLSLMLLINNRNVRFSNSCKNSYNPGFRKNGPGSNQYMPIEQKNAVCENRE